MHFSCWRTVREAIEGRLRKNGGPVKDEQTTTVQASKEKNVPFGSSPAAEKAQPASNATVSVPVAPLNGNGPATPYRKVVAKNADRPSVVPSSPTVAQPSQTVGPVGPSVELVIAVRHSSDTSVEATAPDGDSVTEQPSNVNINVNISVISAIEYFRYAVKQRMPQQRLFTKSDYYELSAPWFSEPYMRKKQRKSHAQRKVYSLVVESKKGFANLL